jgi:hypothetical protein
MENKCCENGMCEKCKGKEACCCCCGCGVWLKKHPSVKKVMPLILIIVAFCLGMAVGCHNDYRERYGGRNFMYNDFGPRDGFKKVWQDEVTVKVQPTVPTGSTVVPPVAQ